MPRMHPTRREIRKRDMAELAEYRRITDDLEPRPFDRFFGFNPRPTPAGLERALKNLRAQERSPYKWFVRPNVAGDGWTWGVGTTSGVEPTKWDAIEAAKLHIVDQEIEALRVRDSLEQMVEGWG